MAGANQHIISYLNYYCRSKINLPFAVLVNGPWGSGKTFFVKRFLETSENINSIEQVKSIYISLYGKSSCRAIEDSFFQQLHPFLAHQGVKLATKLVKGALKGALKIDVNENTTLTIDTEIPSVEIVKELSSNDSYVIVFDDLERCSMPIVDILGYINHIVEHANQKVIIICNENEIKDKEIYLKFKEKLVDKTFTIDFVFDEPVDAFISEISEYETRTFLKEHKENIKGVYVQTGVQNLRSLRSSLIDFYRIVQNIDEDYRKNQSALLHLLKLLIIFSLCIKSGLLQTTDIQSLVYSFSVNEKLKEFKNKFPDIDFSNRILSFETWDHIINNGYIDKCAVHEDLNNSPFFYKKNRIEWLALHDIDRIDESDFTIILRLLITKYEAHEYIIEGEMLHVFGILLMLSKEGLYDKTVNEIVESAKAYIAWLEANDKINGEKPEPLFPGEPDAYLGRIYHEVASPEFRALRDELEQAKEHARERKYKLVADELIDIMDSDQEKFLDLICLTNKKENKYYDIPILKFVDIDRFIEHLLGLRVEQQDVIFLALYTRYNIEFSISKLIEERDWLLSFKSSLGAAGASQFVRRRNAHKISGYIDHGLAKLEEASRLSHGGRSGAA